MEMGFRAEREDKDDFESPRVKPVPYCSGGKKAQADNDDRFCWVFNFLALQENSDVPIRVIIVSFNGQSNDGIMGIDEGTEMIISFALYKIRFIYTV